MDIKQVILNIKALCNKTVTKGCSENEALAAAKKISELMKIYNLSMDRVFIGESQCITDIIQTNRLNKHPIDSCIVGIAEFCDCKCWFNSINKNYNFFGLEPDIEMAKYLYSLIYNAIESSLLTYKKSTEYICNKSVSRKRLSISFQRGMSHRIYYKLIEITKIRKQEEDINSNISLSTGTSLVVIKRSKIDDEFKKLDLKLNKAKSFSKTIHVGAFEAGKIAAEKINLNRPIYTNSKPIGCLT